MEAFTTETMLTLALALMGAGLFAGFVAGMLGVGGGIVIVPALYLTFTALGVDEGVRVHMAVGTSLATIIVTSLRSLLSHNKHEAVDWALLKRWSPPLAVGAAGGSVLAGIFSANVLAGIFGFGALGMATHMILSGNGTARLGDTVPVGPKAWPMVGVMGAASALIGIGGGVMGVTVMKLFGMPIHRAVGTGSGLGVTIGVVGAAGFVLAGWGAEGLPPGSLGYVSLIGFALIIPMTLLMAPLGAKVAHSVSRKALQRVFAVFLIVTAVNMLRELVL